MLRFTQSFIRRRLQRLIAPQSATVQHLHEQFHVKRAVIVQLVGGLANQMICYKLGRYIAKNTERSLILDGTFYTAQPTGTNRNLQLLFHEVKYDVYFDRNSFRAALLHNRSLKSLTGPDFHDFHNDQVKKRALEMIQSHEDFLEIDIWSSLTLRERADQFATDQNILEELRLDTEKHFDDQNKLILRQINACANSTAIHVRRGDYANHAGGMLLQARYYNDAIYQIEENTKSPEFFVFSDDMTWCKEQLKAKSPIHFVDCNDERHGYRDLALASKCKHFIMSSLSTFSHQILELNVPCFNRIVIHSTSDDLAK